MISVERCSQFEDIEHEAQYMTFHEEEEKLTKKLVTLADYERIRNEYQQKFINEKLWIITTGNVVFENVSARYPLNNEDVLKNLTFEVKGGEKIGVVGRTGSGKTSLIKLFWRCLDYHTGNILIDGKDISKCDLKVLRKEMGIISQETALFEGTIRENIDPEGG